MNIYLLFAVFAGMFFGFVFGRVSKKPPAPVAAKPHDIGLFVPPGTKQIEFEDCHFFTSSSRCRRAVTIYFDEKFTLTVSGPREEDLPIVSEPRT